MEFPDERIIILLIGNRIHVFWNQNCEGGGRGAGAEPRLGKSPTLGVTLFYTKIVHIRVSNFSMKLKDPILYENCGGRVGRDLRNFGWKLKKLLEGSILFWN